MSLSGIIAPEPLAPPPADRKTGSHANFGAPADLGNSQSIATTLDPASLEHLRAFPRELARKESRDQWDALLTTVIVLGFFIIVLEVYRLAAFDPVLAAAETHQWMKFITGPSILWAIMGTILLGFRTIFWFRYRPFPA